MQRTNRTIAKTTKTATLGAVLLGASLSLPGCFEVERSAFPEGDDVRLDMPGQFRAAGDRGEVYGLIEDTAQDVNGFVTEMVQGVGTIVIALDGYPPTRRDGSWRVYGPFDDDEGRDLSWMVRIDGDETSTNYEILVGEAGADHKAMDVVMNGGITIDGDDRTGDFRLDFDAIERHPAMKDPEDAGHTFAGAVEITFSRDVSTEQKQVDIDFIDFRESDLLGDAWFSDDAYQYARTDDGAGAFHLAVNGQFDDEAFAGTQVNRLELDAKWTAEGKGRARGMILEVDNETSALTNGDLVIHECFNAGGALSFAGVNEAYAQELADYVDGDESGCAFGEEEL